MRRTTTRPAGRTRRAALAGLVAALAGAALTACGDSGDASADQGGSTDEGQVRTVEHDAGTTENVPAEPKRIVSLSVTLTGHLLALDAPVVATQASPGPFSDDNGFFLQWADVAEQRGVEVVYRGTEASPEKVQAADPDLIIGASSGADSAEQHYDQMSKIAPTLIYGYDDISWQNLTREIGAAIGKQDKAEQVLEEFNGKVDETESAITPPEHSVAPLRTNGAQLAVFTRQSAQGKLLDSLGLTVRSVPDALAGEGPEGGDREDVVTVSAENLGPALGDSSVLFVGHTPEQLEKITSNPPWTVLPAVRQDRTHNLGLDSFRMDYFSASKVLDRVQRLYS